MKEAETVTTAKSVEVKMTIATFLNSKSSSFNFFSKKLQNLSDNDNQKKNSSLCNI